MARVLERYRLLRTIEPPATLDGGDVLVLGRDVIVGLSTRTNAAGADQLARILAPWGYRVRRLRVTGCLHLKTAVTALGEDTVLLNPEWVDRDAFAAYRRVEVDPREPRAANALVVGGRVLTAGDQPRTVDRIAGATGLEPVPIDLRELSRAEAGVTCCSVLVENPELSRSAAPAR